MWQPFSKEWPELIYSLRLSLSSFANGRVDVGHASDTIRKEGLVRIGGSYFSILAPASSGID